MLTRRIDHTPGAFFHATARRWAACAILLAGLAAAPHAARAHGFHVRGTADTTGDVLEAVGGRGMCGIFIYLVARSGLSTELKTTGPWTVFAPADEAFDAVPRDQLRALADDPKAARALVWAHVAKGHWLVGDFRTDAKKFGRVPFVAKGHAEFSYDGRYYRIGPAVLIDTDVGALNGTVQIVERLLAPVPKFKTKKTKPGVPGSKPVAPAGRPVR